MEKLEKILEIQEKERKDESFSRVCLFCRKFFSGNRKILLDHLFFIHNFSIGLPDNLVFVEEFLDLLESKLNHLICLFCEKVFKDWLTLKEHMRKKGHKQLNPNNKDYDKFYVINYRDLDLNLKIGQNFVNENKNWNDTWGDWVKLENDLNIICLFCSFAANSIDVLKNHLFDVHQFDFKIIAHLSFYNKIKLINYIRKSVSENTCYFCKQRAIDLTDHLKNNSSCINLPNQSSYDDDQFYIPLIENDGLLQSLTDDEDNDE